MIRYRVTVSAKLGPRLAEISFKAGINLATLLRERYLPGTVAVVTRQNNVNADPLQDGSVEVVADANSTAEIVNAFSRMFSDYGMGGSFSSAYIVVKEATNKAEDVLKDTAVLTAQDVKAGVVDVASTGAKAYGLYLALGILAAFAVTAIAGKR